MLCANSVKAETWTEFLKGTSWQMQNPQPESWSVLWTFKNGGNYQTNIADMNTNTSRYAIGTYSISGNQLTIVCNSQTYVYSLNYVNENKIEARFNGGTFQLARSKSSEDRWFENYLMFHTPSNNSNYYNNGNKTKSTYEVCYTCRGVGRCTICRGLGKNSNPYTGERSLCSACGGTGKCWHCYGSGKQ